MKFRVERDALADAVAWTAKSLPTRPSVPGARRRAACGSPTASCTVSGFDYEVSSQVTVGVQADSDGAALVSGRLLAEITKALPAKPVEVAAVGTHLELVCGSARFTLPTMPVEDYPTLPTMPETAGIVDAADVRPRRRPGRDRGRPGRDDPDADRRADGARGHHAGPARHRPLPGRRAGDDRGARTRTAINLQALVPARTLADTAKTLGPLGGEVTVALSRGGVGEGMIGFAGGTRRTTSRLLDPDFPKIRSLFPDQHNARARLSVAALTEVVKRVALVADRTTPVRLSFAEGEVVVEAGGSEDARASEAMEGEFTGEALTVAFNPDYLLDGLSVLDAPTRADLVHDRDEAGGHQPGGRGRRAGSRATVT